jgi:hypothetical protein
MAAFLLIKKLSLPKRSLAFIVKLQAHLPIFSQAVFHEVLEGNYFVGGKALTDFLICIWRTNTSQHKKER